MVWNIALNKNHELVRQNIMITGKGHAISSECHGTLHSHNIACVLKCIAQCNISRDTRDVVSTVLDCYTCTLRTIRSMRYPYRFNMLTWYIVLFYTQLQIRSVFDIKLVVLHLDWKWCWYSVCIIIMERCLKVLNVYRCFEK